MLNITCNGKQHLCEIYKLEFPLKIQAFDDQANRLKGLADIRQLPPAAIPVAAARASKRPTARNGALGMDSISSVTMPA